MEKLKFFTFNNLRWEHRAFRFSEIAGNVDLVPLLETWLEPFAVGFADPPEQCLERLFQMICTTGTVKMTSRHFVDAAGVAWPEDSFAVIAGETGPESSCVLVSPNLNFS